MSIPCHIQQTKDAHIWHLKFRSYLVGTYKIYLFHNGLSIMSKLINYNRYLLFVFFLDSPYLIQVKDIDGKNHFSGITNTPCVIQSINKDFFVL